MIQHVTLELRREDAEREARFWELLGFARAARPASMGDRSLWLERGGTQVHLAYEEKPDVPRRGHVGVVSEDFDAVVSALRAAGHAVDPREEHWGAARIYARSPAGHTVEVMAAPPPGG